MLLALDIGNTEITVGLFRGDDLIDHWRLTTSPDRTPDEWGIALGGFLLHAGHGARDIRAACLGSVVPPVTAGVIAGVHKLTRAQVLVVDPESPLPLTLDVDEPLTVGADRIVNGIAALELFPGDTVVVDFGTATTFDCITADRRFIGGAIMPGLRTSSDELTRKTAKLPATELAPPTRAIGRRTEECIQAGVLFGTADAVDGMIRRVREEWPGGARPRVIATGGLARVVARHTQLIEEVVPDLTLQGLRLCARMLGASW